LARSPSRIFEGDPLANAILKDTSIDEGIAKNLGPRGLICANLVENKSVPRNFRANAIRDTTPLSLEYFAQGSEGMMVDEKPGNYYHIKLNSDPKKMGPQRSVN
jgi:hypothetical protein